MTTQARVTLEERRMTQDTGAQLLALLDDAWAVEREDDAAGVRWLHQRVSRLSAAWQARRSEQRQRRAEDGDE